MHIPMDNGHIALDPQSGSTVFTGRYRRHRFTPHFHHEFSIGIIESGACEFLCNGRPQIARADEVFVIDPFVVHTGTPAGEELRYRVLHPSRDLMRQALGEQDGRLAFATPVIRESGALATVHRLLDAGDARRKAAAAIRKLAGAHGVCIEPKAAPPAIVTQACAWLAEHWSEPFDLARTAAALGVSRYHFSRVFRHITGLTPSTYHRLVRLDRARRALHGGLPLADVALATGFVDQSHFTHAFKAVTGLTPAAYARSLRQTVARSAAVGAGNG